MRKTLKLMVAIGMVAVVSLPAAHAVEQPELIEVMVFSETAGFRHSSIPDGMQMMDDLAANETFSSVDFNITHVTDSSMTDSGVTGWPNNLPATTGSAFSDENLAQFDVAVFISTTANVLESDEQAAFERWVQDGGGYVGIHAAADAEYEWPWYGDFVGAQFDSHPSIQEAAVDIEDGSHISTSHLPQRWTRTDEWYNYRQNPREYVCHTRPEVVVNDEVGVETEMVGTYAWIFWYPGKDVQNTLQVDAPKDCGVNVLMTLDETSYSGGNMGDHAITWCNEWDGGRAWYTGMGHTEESFADPAFVEMVTGGLLTASGIEGLSESPDFEHLDGVSFECEPDTAE